MLVIRPWFISFAALAMLGVPHWTFAQQPQRAPRSQPIGGAQPLERNTFEPGRPAATPNKIAQPIPLTPPIQENALAGIDRQLGEQVARVKEKLTSILPDELAILAKTTGWEAEKQSALVAALRAGEPTAVFQAWSQGNPQDMAGAEIAARQTAAKLAIRQLEQDVKDRAPIGPHFDDLKVSLEKIAGSTPGTDEVLDELNPLATLAEVRQLIATSAPAKGAVAKLPLGEVPLVYIPTLAVGDAIVLGNNAVLVGNEGRGPLRIAKGNAAQALGMPIVTGNPLPETEGEPMSEGTLVVNPRTSEATIHYNVNGNRYVMEPGMSQKLPAEGSWVVAYDPGEGQPPAAYTVTPGTYHFRPTDKGWQLYKYRFDVTIDNSQNGQEFHCLIGDETVTIPPNASRTITSSYPVAIKYDRGNGSALVSRTVNASGTVQVGVNVADNLWDLFPTNENQRETINIKLFD